MASKYTVEYGNKDERRIVSAHRSLATARRAAAALQRKTSTWATDKTVYLCCDGFVRAWGAVFCDDYLYESALLEHCPHSHTKVSRYWVSCDDCGRVWQ